MAVTLYHSSKSGIQGIIAPASRKHCDFGKGFYMGTDQIQPLTLICNYPNAKIYTLSVTLSGLNILEVEAGLDWALLVAYNRGKMESVKSSGLYHRIANLNKGCDLLIGPIANDRKFIVLDRFFNGEITDAALINSLSALKLGKQYVALTERACKNIKILDEQRITKTDRDKLKQISELNRSKGIAMADEICRKYRRDGQFFDEILKAGEEIEKLTLEKRQLCDIQGRLFELAQKSGLDCPSFIEAFMNSRAAAALDDVYDRLQWAGEEYILEELEDEARGLKKAGTAYCLDAMYWIGYTYRYWHYYTNEFSREIYKIADAETMNECLPGFHTLDVEMAIDDLQEIHREKEIPDAEKSI